MAGWINPLISAASGVSGAAIGAYAVLRSARAERRGQERAQRLAVKRAAQDELRARLAEYLDATDRLVDTIAEIPPTGRRTLLVRRLHPIQLLQSRREITLRMETKFAVVSRRFQEVGDNFYAARARLRLIAPPSILDLMDQLDALLPHRRWRHLGWTILPDYEELRRQFIQTSRQMIGEFGQFPGDAGGSAAS
jgi:hypothetical protein